MNARAGRVDAVVSQMYIFQMRSVVMETPKYKWLSVS